MKNKLNNFAYIDGANLYKGMESLGWKLDYARFRIWLAEKYGVKNAYIFIGLIPRYKDLYKYLQECGFTLVFKEVVYGDDGKAKGNCDAALVLNAVSDFYEKRFEKAIIISSDGDYAEFIGFLKAKGILKIVISPSHKCSYLLRKQNIPLLYLDAQRGKLEFDNLKRKSPR